VVPRMYPRQPPEVVPLPAAQAGRAFLQRSRSRIEGDNRTGYRHASHEGQQLRSEASKQADAGSRPPKRNASGESCSRSLGVASLKGEAGRGHLPDPLGQRLSYFFSSITSFSSAPVNRNGILSA